MKNLNCIVCSKILKGNQRKFCSIICLGKKHISIRSSIRIKSREQCQCVICDKILSANQTMFCSYECTNKFSKYRPSNQNRDQSYARKKNPINCAVCCNPILKSRRKYCSKICSKNGLKEYQKNNKTTNNKTKEKLVFLSGGCCQSCVYDKNYAALQFQHIDPKTKLFPLNATSCGMYTWEELTKELVKCLLLCANCHLELHNPKREKVNTTH